MGGQQPKNEGLSDEKIQRGGLKKGNRGLNGGRKTFKKK